MPVNSVLNLNPSYPTSNNPLPLDKVVEELTTLRVKIDGTDKKLCLLIGRRPNEEVPTDNPNEIWVSLNTQDEQTCDGRFHLCMDFNTDLTDKITGLFDKVVTDYSTIKFFNVPVWEKIHKMLKPNPESMAVTINDGSISYGEGEIVDYKTGILDIPFTFINRMDEKKAEIDQLRLTYLQGLFESAELKTDEAWPYLGQKVLEEFRQYHPGEEALRFSSVYVLKGPK